MENNILYEEICFPLYVASKEVIRLYKPYLDDMDLTYTQYLVMSVLWEQKEMNVKELGKYLFLDSGTLTPLLKKLDKKGYINKNRLSSDERNVIITLTKEGEKLQSRAVDISTRISQALTLDENESQQLQALLQKIIEK